MDEEFRSKVSVVIPALNEERSIVEITEKCLPYSNDVLILDGDSTDRTVELGREAGARIVVCKERGKGRALRKAIAHVKNEITVFIDADGSHDPDEIPNLVQPILEDKADHVSGSRLLGGSDELHGTFDECFRLMGSSFITAMINWKFGVRLSESQNGFRAAKTEVLRSLDLRENITTIEQEMIIKTLKKGYRMMDVPSHEYRRKFGESHIKLTSVSYRYVYSFLKYLFF